MICTCSYILEPNFSGCTEQNSTIQTVLEPQDILLSCPIILCTDTKNKVCLGAEIERLTALEFKKKRTRDLYLFFHFTAVKQWQRSYLHPISSSTQVSRLLAIYRPNFGNI